MVNNKDMFFYWENNEHQPFTTTHHQKQFKIGVLCITHRST